MERQFTSEIASLRLGEGETFHGEGILGVTKGLLQSGVSYVGGYQGAPVSHLLDERYLIQGKASLATLGYAERIYARSRNWFAQLSVDF